MANTYTLIQAQTLASSAANVTFSSIPATYTDLVVRVSGRSANASVGSDFIMQLNGVSTNRSFTNLYGNGTTTASSAGTSDVVSNIVGNNATANTYSNFECYIPNYLSSNNKSFNIFEVDENNATTSYQYMNAGLWSSSAVITSITFSAESGANILATSSFYLYGIKNS